MDAPLRIYTEPTTENPLGGIWSVKPFAFTHVVWVEESDHETALAARDAEIAALRARIAEKDEALGELLELHIAHHNNPAHVRARKALEG